MWYLILVVCTCFEEKSIDQALLNDVKSSWAEFDQDYFRQASGVVRCTSSGPAAAKQVIRFKSQEKRFLLITDGMSPEDPQQLSAMVFNEHYGFLLEKPQQDSEWAISKIVDREKEGSLDKIGLSKQTSLFRSLFSPISFQEITFLDLWRSKGFQLTRCSKSGEIVEIEFVYEAETEIDPATNQAIAKPADYIESGRMVLDVSNRFLPLEIVVTRSTPKSVASIRSATQYFYDDSSPQLESYYLPVKSITNHRYSPTLNIKSESVFEWELKEKLGYEDFTLTSFGLIEPEWILNRSSARLPIILAALSVIFISVGFYCFKGASR